MDGAATVVLVSTESPWLSWSENETQKPQKKPYSRELIEVAHHKNRVNGFEKYFGAVFEIQIARGVLKIVLPETLKTRANTFFAK